MSEGALICKVLEQQDGPPDVSLSAQKLHQSQPQFIPSSQNRAFKELTGLDFAEES